MSRKPISETHFSIPEYMPSAAQWEKQSEERLTIYKIKHLPEILSFICMFSLAQCTLELKLELFLVVPEKGSA